jgi:hypothetical protein
MEKNFNKLIVQVSLQKFSFVVKDYLSHEVSFFASEAINTDKSLEEQLDHIFNKYSILTEQYDEIIVLHDSSLNTFVPKAIFSEESMGSYLQYNTKVFATDFFAYDELELYDMNNVYLPFININNFLLDKLGTFTYQNINTELVSQVLNLSKETAETQVYTYIQKSHFEIVVAKAGKLLLFNSFDYNTVQDFIYYILFTFEQLQLDPERTPLYLLGCIEEEDELYKQAYTFVRHISIINKKAFINVDLALHYQVPKHYYILFHS